MSSTAVVEMTTMDMGVTRQSAVEGKAGHYSLLVRFAMKGPWRVTLRVAQPKNKPFVRAVAFQVGR